MHCKKQHSIREGRKDFFVFPVVNVRVGFFYAPSLNMCGGVHITRKQPYAVGLIV